MEATVLDKNFDAVAIIDTYDSFIWTDRYDKFGDFEICITIQNELPTFLQKGYYLWNADSEHIMEIETIKIESDDEEGAKYVVSGRSLETILKRRIVWNKAVFNMATDGTYPNLQNGIKTLLTDNAIAPALSVRKIDNFIFEESTDPKITSLTFVGEYLGEELYDVVRTLCVENEIGFKITLNEDKQLVFKLYAGIDHSYAQDTNPYVVFSPDFDNIFKTNYLDSDEAFKNVTLVVGESEYDEEGKEISRIQHVLDLNNEIHTGLDRREIFTDATSLSTDDDYGGTLSAEQYDARLKQKGIDTLMDSTTITAFEGSIDPMIMFRYGVDYVIGDIVQVANEYGHEGQSRISEFVISCDERGTFAYPTFQAIQKGVYES